MIGSDQYWDLVTGDVIKGKEGPITVNSKFGWLLSGPVHTPSNEQDNNFTMTNLCIDKNPLKKTRLVMVRDMKWDFPGRAQSLRHCPLTTIKP